jgi:hypothetical protein
MAVGASAPPCPRDHRTNCHLTFTTVAGSMNLGFGNRCTVSTSHVGQHHRQLLEAPLRGSNIPIGRVEEREKTISVAMPSDGTKRSRETHRRCPRGGVVEFVGRVVAVESIEDAGRADCGDTQRRGTASLERASLYRARRVGLVTDGQPALFGARDTVTS